MRTQRVLQFGKHCCYDSQTNAHKESARSAKRERESVAGVMAVQRQRAVGSVDTLCLLLFRFVFFALLACAAHVIVPLL